MASARSKPISVLGAAGAGSVCVAPDWEDRVLLEKFWFDSTAQYAPVRMLSGGERRRLQLVMVLATKPNLLVLDEPTNDLDLDTLRAMESFLDDWPGALVVAMPKSDPLKTQSLRSDRQGRVHVTLGDPGPWLIKAVHIVRLENNPRAEWESLWASLSFALTARGR